MMARWMEIGIYVYRRFKRKCVVASIDRLKLERKILRNDSEFPGFMKYILSSPQLSKIRRDDESEEKFMVESLNVNVLLHVYFE